MPAERTIMRQVREVLRLRFVGGVPIREIARRIGVAASTVRATIKRFQAAGLSWPLSEEMTDAVLEARLFADAGTKQGHRRQIEPDWASIHREAHPPMFGSLLPPSYRNSTTPVDNLWANLLRPTNTQNVGNARPSKGADLAVNRQLPSGRSSIMLKDAIEAERAERDQDADCARIDAAIGSSEQDIAALEDRQLDPDEMRKQWSTIRDRTILAIRDVVHNVVKRAKEANATKDWMIQKLVREESDGRVMGEFSVALKEVPTRDIVDYLRYLVLVGDRARIQSVRIVFAERKDRQAYDVTFGKMLAQFALAEHGDLGERLIRICRLAEKVDARIANLFCTYSITNHSRALTPPQFAQVKVPVIDAVDSRRLQCNPESEYPYQLSIRTTCQPAYLVRI